MSNFWLAIYYPLPLRCSLALMKRYGERRDPMVVRWVGAWLTMWSIIGRIMTLHLLSVLIVFVAPYWHPFSID